MFDYDEMIIKVREIEKSVKYDIKSIRSYLDIQNQEYFKLQKLVREVCNKSSLTISDKMHNLYNLRCDENLAKADDMIHKK